MKFSFRMHCDARLIAVLFALVGVAAVLMYGGDAADRIKNGIGPALLAAGLFFGSHGRGRKGPGLRL